MAFSILIYMKQNNAYKIILNVTKKVRWRHLKSLDSNQKDFTPLPPSSLSFPLVENFVKGVNPPESDAHCVCTSFDEYVITIRWIASSHFSTNLNLQSSIIDVNNIVLNYHGFRLTTTTNSIAEDSSSKHGSTSSGLICVERIKDLILIQ